MNNLLDHSFDLNTFLGDSINQVISNPLLTRELNFDTLLNQDPLNNIGPFLEASIPLDSNHPSNNLGNNNKAKVYSIFKVSDIPYQPTPFSGPEPLMYITLNIFGNPIKALVDTGATRSFIGPDGLDLFEKLGLKIDIKIGLVKVANSHIELVSQEVLTQISLKNKVRQMKIRILPSLPVSFAIGLDFLKAFRINHQR